MYEESVNDCKLGLLLNKSYIKLYLRIAVIKKEYKDINEAAEWCKKGLEVESENKTLRNLLDELKVNPEEIKPKADKSISEEVKNNLEEVKADLKEVKSKLKEIKVSLDVDKSESK